MLLPAKTTLWCVLASSEGLLLCPFFTFSFLVFRMVAVAMNSPHNPFGRKPWWQIKSHTCNQHWGREKGSDNSRYSVWMAAVCEGHCSVGGLLWVPGSITIWNNHQLKWAQQPPPKMFLLVVILKTFTVIIHTHTHTLEKRPISAPAHLCFPRSIATSVCPLACAAGGPVRHRRIQVTLWCWAECFPWHQPGL